MPTAITSSPVLSASVIWRCSFAFFICGRIIRKYRITNIRMMGSMPINVSPPWGAAAWAYALEIMGFSGRKVLMRQGFSLRLKPSILSWRHLPFPPQMGSRNEGATPRRGFFSALPAFAGPVGVEGGPPGGESACLDGRAHLPGEVEVEVEVVQRVQARAQDLVGPVQVVQVGPREVAARMAAAGGIERTGVVAVPRVLDLHVAESGEEPAVPRVAGRHDAVEHVEPARDALHDVLGGAHAHEVTGRVHGQARRRVGHEALHVLLGLAHRDAAHGVAVEADRKSVV